MEAALLGLFMISACGFGALIEHPASPVRETIDAPFARRVLMGCAMGATAVTLIRSPWGGRSGAHMNPAVTLAFFRLGKIQPLDAVAYMCFQFIGGAAGVWIASLALGTAISDPAVNYVVTLPGIRGSAVAWIAEFVISAAMMMTVLIVSNRASLAHLTPQFAGSLLVLFIAFEAPLSGMSLNPARSFGSALPANVWTGFWIYMTAPTLAMLAVSELYVRCAGVAMVHCAKLHHCNSQRCIFICEFGRLFQADNHAIPDEESTQPRSAASP